MHTYCIACSPKIKQTGHLVYNNTNFNNVNRIILIITRILYYLQNFLDVGSRRGSIIYSTIFTRSGRKFSKLSENQWKLCFLQRSNLLFGGNFEVHSRLRKNKYFYKTFASNRNLNKFCKIIAAQLTLGHNFISNPTVLRNSARLKILSSFLALLDFMFWKPF